MRRELTETVPVNGMSAGHFVTGGSRRKEVFLADGTIGLVFAVFAIVIVVESSVDAHAAIVTVLEVLSTTDATESTIFTMVRTLFIRHPQVTSTTMIGTKLNTT